jgi:predicted kinase
MELNIHEKFNAALKEMMARKAPKDEIQKLIDDYKAQKDATVKSPESKTEVKKDDFVSSIPGLKEKLVKTQETKNPEVNIPSPKKTTATKVEEPTAETVAETTEQATYDEADFNLESEINQLQKEGLWNDNKKPSDSDPHVNPNDDRISTTLGKKYYKPDGSPMTNKEVREYDDANRVDISGFETASKLVESLKDPAEWAQMYSNAQAIKKDIPLRLLNAWNSTQAFGMEYLKAEHKKRNLAYGIEDPEYEREINLWIANKYKEIETRKLLFSYDGKGIVSGVRAGDASDVISGVLNAVASTIETVGPAVLTRGASLFPQVTFPMYTDYNTIKAKRIYGDDPDAIEKLVYNNETEVALPVALGLVAVGLEKVGLGGITKHIASKPVKGVAVAKLLWVGSGEGSTEWAQLGVEKINTGLAEGKSIEESSALAWDAMSSDEGLEAFINGFIGSTTVAGGSNIINRALRNDNASIKDVNDKINNIADLNNVKYTTRNTDIRDAIDLEIKDAEQDLKKYIIEKRKLSEVLTDSEKTLLVNTLNEKTNIKQKAESLREQLENGDITRVEFGYGIRGLNNQDKRLSDKINEIQGAATNRAAGKITESVKEQIKKSGLDGNIIEMTSEEISNIQEEGFDSKTAAGEFGFIKQSTDGSFEIVLNKDKPMIGTAAHEFMHAVLFKTIGANIDLQNNLGDALIDHVSGLGGDKSILGKRLMSYGQFQKDGTFIRDDNFGEETITIMSEAIVDGSLKFEENFFTKIGDVVRRFSQDYLGKEIKFDTGRDVYNFVKDYSKSIKEGKVSKAILNVAKEGAQGKLTETATDTKAGGTKFSKEASDEVQRIYDEKGNAGVFDIIEQFKPIVNKIVQKRSEAPGFDRELLTSEIEIGKRGILDLVREYDPKSGVPLAAFINKYLPARAIEASRRILGEEFMDDVDTMVNVASEEVSTETEVKPERKKVVLSDKLGVKSKVDSAIKAKLSTLDLENLNFKNLKDQTPEITGELFGIDPKKLISSANITKKELQSAQMFINKNADLLLSMLPEGATTGGTATGVPKTLLDAFYVKADRAKMAKTGSKAGLAIQVKKENISNKEFLEVFGIIDGKPVRDDRNTSARVLALANQTGKMMSNQAVRQELVNQGKPLSALSYIADGKATIMFSKQEQAVGAIDRSLSLEDRIIFWDGISDFANDDVLYTDKNSIKSGLIRAFADSPEILSKVDKLAEALYSVMSRLSVGIIKDPVKLTEKLLQTNNKQLTKIKEFFRSTVTATDAFKDEQRVKNFRATTIDFANKIFNPSDPGKSIAKILMLKGHLASSSRNSYLKRKQLFPDNAEFIKGTLESTPGIVVNTGKTKDGKTAITSIVYNEVVVTVPNITSSQASASALNDTKNANKLKERNTNEDIAKELLDEYTSFYADLYNSNKIDNVDLVMVSAALLSNMDSVLARSAKLMYITDNIYDFKDPGKEVKYEHTQPRVAALLGIWDAKINNKDSVNIKDLLKNYTIQIIPNTMDRVITESGLGDALFDGQKLSDPSWIRTFNEKTKENSKGRLRPLVNVYTKEVLTPTAAFVKGANIIKEGLKENKIISKATMFSRPVNPAKGISVLDFDDTLATTKSGVRYTLPNPDGTPQPKKKVIFMAGGPGSGKSNVINQLGLKEQGFKVVNQDISLEWLMKNHGMPTDMREFTPEQASEFGKLSAEARGIALKKRIKYQGEGDGVVIDGTGASLNVMKKNIQDFKDKGYDVQMIFVETSQETALSRNKARKERSLRTGIVIKTHDSVQANKEAYKELFGERFAEVNTDNLKQGDVIPADIVNKVNDFTSGYIKGRLNAGEYATKGEELKQQGAEFDFSEFNQVVEGKTAPLFNKAMKLQEKFTSKDMFVLTARPAESNQAIFEFLQANGLNIPIENIAGLGSSASADKALWMAGKVGEGYNDFYFADDILENVQAVSDMLDQFDVKSKVQQAKRDFVLGDPKVTKLLDEKSMNDVKDVDGLANPGVYSSVKFSKSHRAEYENTVAKNRPDLSGKEVTATIDKMFEYIDGLDVPNKRKYEQITTKWLATSNIKLPEDSYKIQQAVEIAELKKEDIFSYKNPNEIIEKYAGTIKVKPISPVGIKEFTRATGFNDPITTEYGIVEYEVEETREAQQKVRDIVSAHWGPNSNPWCITKIDKDGNLSEDAWRDWTSYGKGPKRIVFQNGKLLAMKANYEYWGKMNKHSEGPIIQVKEGNVTNTTELVVGDGGIVNPIIRETRTVSKDGNTVTTNIFEDSQDGYADGTTIVENRIKGVKTKETRFDPDGSKVSTQEFNKKGKPTTSYQFNPNGKVKSVNGHLQQQAIAEAGLDVNAREDADIDLTNELVVRVGDIIENNYTETETDGTTTDYFYGRALVGNQVMEIGFESKTSLDLADVTKTVNGKTRLDIGKVIREVDPDVKGLPKTGVKFSKGISKEFNDIIEQSTGVGSEKVFSDAQAKIRGNKRRFDNIVPYSVQDLMGLLYNFVGRGKAGEQHMEFFKKALIDPFARAINELNQSKQSSAGDYSNLTKAFPNVKKKLNKEVESGDYTYDQAIRVYLWNKAGFEVPGLSKRDLNTLDSIVKNDPELQAFADTLGLISKKEEGYAKPGEYWLVENIASDLLSDGSIGDARSEFLAEWQQNADEMFSKENLNKIQAIYGNKFREALEDILYRMKHGTNRPTGSSRLTNNFMNWINNSTGAIMFFNMRSALLQTLSTTNYINWTDNNPLKAAMAFANQRQYWSDFSALFNSDFLKQRRSGNQRSINEAELTTAVANSDNKAKAAIAWLLQKGFLPTQIMDSFAISSGGATFYRNRINKYIKEGMSPEQAQEKAFLDFQEITEATQQSARPDMISQQQASPLGRLILSFQNTPMQYARIMNKAARDIVNGRGDQKSNISKIVYYGALQSIIFAALQSAIFAALGDDEEEEFDKKKQRIVGSMVDGWLAGLGVAGKAIGTIERSIKEYLKQKERGFNADHAQTIIQLLGFSPPIGSKLRKIYSAIQTEEFNKGVSEKRGFTLDNPTWSSWGNVIEGFTNIPLGRISNKLLNIDNALDSQNQWWERAALLLGWNTWDLGIKDPDIIAVKGEIKEERKVEKKEEALIKKEEKKKEVEEENISKEKANIELQKKEIEDGNKSPDCAAINKRGERCGTKIEKGSTYCTVHTKVEQNDGGEKTQCGKTKKDGKRCKMQTSNKSGYCYYHD